MEARREVVSASAVKLLPRVTGGRPCGRARQPQPARVQTSKPGQTSTHVVAHPRGLPRAARGRASDALVRKQGQNGSNGGLKTQFLLESVVPARALRAAVGRHHGAGVARLFVSSLVSSTSAGRTHSLTTVFGRRQTSHAQPAVASRRGRRRAARRTVAAARRRVCGRKRGMQGAEALLSQ